MYHLSLILDLMLCNLKIKNHSKISDYMVQHSEHYHVIISYECINSCITFVVVWRNSVVDECPKGKTRGSEGID